jgi:hypothetical protein
MRSSPPLPIGSFSNRSYAVAVFGMVPTPPARCGFSAAVGRRIIAALARHSEIGVDMTWRQLSGHLNFVFYGTNQLNGSGADGITAQAG